MKHTVKAVLIPAIGLLLLAGTGVAWNMADAKAPAGAQGEPPDDPNAMVQVVDANGNTVMDPKTGKPLKVRLGGDDFPWKNMTPEQITEQQKQHAVQFGPPKTQPRVVWGIGPDGKPTRVTTYDLGPDDVQRPTAP